MLAQAQYKYVPDTAITPQQSIDYMRYCFSKYTESRKIAKVLKGFSVITAGISVVGFSAGEELKPVGIGFAFISAFSGFAGIINESKASSWISKASLKPIIELHKVGFIYRFKK